MADETKTYVFGNGDGATVPAWYAMNGNNGLLGGNGLPFTRFYADCIGSGTPIDWEDMI